MDLAGPRTETLAGRPSRLCPKRDRAPCADVDTQSTFRPRRHQGMAPWPVGADCSEEYGGAAMDWTMAAIAARSWAGPTSAWPSPFFTWSRRPGDSSWIATAPELKAEILPRVTAVRLPGIATTSLRAARHPGGLPHAGRPSRAASGHQRRKGLHQRRAASRWPWVVSTSFLARHRVPIRPPATGLSPSLPCRSKHPGIMPTYFKDMGRMGISTGGFAMTDVRLPAKHQVGDLHRGFYHAMEGFSAARVPDRRHPAVGASEAVPGSRRRAHQAAPGLWPALASYEGISFPMADHYANLESTRLLVYKAAWIMDQKYGAGAAGYSDIALAAAVAKLARRQDGPGPDERGGRLVWGHGLHQRVPRRDGHPWHPLLLHWRRGTMNIMRLIISRELLGPEFLPYRN